MPQLPIEPAFMMLQCRDAASVSFAPRRAGEMVDLTLKCHGQVVIGVHACNTVGLVADAVA